MEYKVGDRIRIKSFEEIIAYAKNKKWKIIEQKNSITINLENKYWINFIPNSGRVYYVNRYSTIKRIDYCKDGLCCIYLDTLIDFAWFDWMFDELYSMLENNYKKEL